MSSSASQYLFLLGASPLSPLLSPARPTMPQKKKRNLPGNPDPSAEVIALSPGTLMATNRFLCDFCGRGFQREQNLQLHLRGHNMPWKLKQRDSRETLKRKKVYVCPEETCVHHDPSRALGDLTGIKKHFWRKHGEKRWTCPKCSKKYAVISDWKSHVKTCGTREYKCSCGTVFARKDSYAAHKAFCEALAEESAKYCQIPNSIPNPNPYPEPSSNPNPNPYASFHVGVAPMHYGPLYSAEAFQWQRRESQMTRDFMGVTVEPEMEFLSMNQDTRVDNGGKLLNISTSFTSTPRPWRGMRN